MTDQPISFERLLTYQETGKLLGVTDRTIFSLVERGDLPVVRFGHNVRIDPADLRAFVERSKSAIRTGVEGGNHDHR